MDQNQQDGNLDSQNEAIIKDDNLNNQANDKDGVVDTQEKQRRSFKEQVEYKVSLQTKDLKDQLTELSERLKQVEAEKNELAKKDMTTQERLKLELDQAQANEELYKRELELRDQTIKSQMVNDFIKAKLGADCLESELIINTYRDRFEVNKEKEIVLKDRTDLEDFFIDLKDRHKSLFKTIKIEGHNITNVDQQMKVSPEISVDDLWKQAITKTKAKYA